MKENLLIEAASENMEVLIDAAIDSEILTSIPIVGTAFKIVKGCLDIRDRLFAEKLLLFLKGLDGAVPELKEKIRQRVSEDPAGSRKVGETLLLLIDRLADIDKADITAKVFIAYIYDHLTAIEFRRIAQSIDQAFISDLFKFLGTHDPSKKGSSQEGWMDSLYPSGLTKIVLSDMLNDVGEIYFEISSIGKILITAYNHGMKLTRKQLV